MASSPPNGCSTGVSMPASPCSASATIMPAVTKDASLIVIDGNRGLGNGQVFPAGPLRAPLKPQIARTDALVIVGNGTAAEGVVAEIAAQGKPVLRAHLQPDAAQVASLRG